MSGVDLNRNYGYHYASSSEDNDTCAETYRGPFSFSEPETQAIQKLVESEPTITSAMNFHAYGNMWIHPFNYMKEKGKYPDNLDPTLLNFYEQFKSEVKSVSDSYYGNAIEMVEYATDGEASDWMLGEHNIIAFSPELGSKNDQANDFYIRKDLIVDVIDENFKVIDLFLKRNEFQLNNLSYGFDNKKRFFIEFENMGLANIYNPTFVFETENDFLITGVDKIVVKNRSGEKLSTTIEKSEDSKQMTVTFEKLLRFHSFKMVLNFKDHSIDANKFAFTVDMKMNSGYNFGTLKLAYGGKGSITSMFFSLLIVMTLCIASLAIVLLGKMTHNKGERNNSQNNQVNINAVPVNVQPEITLQLTP